MQCIQAGFPCQGNWDLHLRDNQNSWFNIPDYIKIPIKKPLHICRGLISINLTC